MIHEPYCNIKLDLWTCAPLAHCILQDAALPFPTHLPNTAIGLKECRAVCTPVKCLCTTQF